MLKRRVSIFYQDFEKYERQLKNKIYIGLASEPEVANEGL